MLLTKEIWAVKHNIYALTCPLRTEISLYFVNLLMILCTVNDEIFKISPSFMLMITLKPFHNLQVQFFADW